MECIVIITPETQNVVHVGNGLNDQQWHSVRLVRRATQVSLQVDNETPTLDHTMGRHSILQYRDIHVGMVGNDSNVHASPPASGSPGPIPPSLARCRVCTSTGSMSLRWPALDT
ncbi:Neurexin-1a [Chionoecetes opilio]|nr:Neurexin-1a [Chionoecetes opilio]